jgi:hypothetical protein
MEVLLKTYTTHKTGLLSRLPPILVAILTVAVMASIATAAISSPAKVNLGTAGNFAILAKTGISTTGVTLITGDIGVSPAAATFMTGFGLIMDASGTFSTSLLVVGNVNAADYTSPASTKMTTAVSDMETAYTDAAGRTSPDYTELYAGDVTGKTLTPGLYKWSTGVLISAGGVTISGTASDVWIFQVAQNLELASGAAITLSGGAQSSRVFWQVAGQVTLGTTAAMKGIILCKTAITMSTGATLTGRALAQTAVTLDANTVNRPVSVGVIGKDASAQKLPLIRNLNNQSVAFTFPSNGTATLRISNMLGQEIATFFNGETKSGNCNQMRFNTSGLVKGLYLAKLEVNGTVRMIKRLLVR